jgi:hypothetical protein
MRNRRTPACLALLLAAVLLSPPPLPALEATQDFELQNGESISLQSFSITATGGFHGYLRGADKTGDILMFVRDGSSTENARVVVRRMAGAGHTDVRTGPRLPYIAFSDDRQGWSQLDAAQKWTANGIVFIYYTFEGQGENAGRKHTMVFATIGEDKVTLILQSRTSIWREAFDGLAALVASVHPTEKGR